MLYAEERDRWLKVKSQSRWDIIKATKCEWFYQQAAIERNLVVFFYLLLLLFMWRNKQTEKDFPKLFPITYCNHKSYGGIAKKTV